MFDVKSDQAHNCFNVINLNEQKILILWLKVKQQMTINFETLLN